jgi:hypothetical protein
MNYLVLVLSAVLAGSAAAQEVGVLELERLSMDYAKIANNRDSYLPYEDPGRDRYDTNETWYYSTGVNFDLNLLRYKDYRFHWDQRVHGEATEAQFRAVAWEFRWGVKYKDRFEVFYDHRSSHIMDAAPESPRTFDLMNHYGLEITFYNRTE